MKSEDQNPLGAWQLPRMIPTSLGEYDLSKFDVHFFVDAEPERVFSAWATSQGLQSFFIQRAEYHHGESMRGPTETIQAGDKYRWIWPNGNSLEGSVLGVEQNRELVFSFGQPGKLAVVIAAEDRGAKIHLIQSEIPVTYDDLVHTHINCRGAWIHFLTCLKAWLETGSDAREHKPHLSGSLSTAYDFKHRK
jgi:uncharacterized protein YndB with AHSA1/START domain